MISRPTAPVQTRLSVDAVAVPGGRACFQSRRILFDDGRQAPLTRMEASLLRFLASSPGRPISRHEILRHVWQIDSSRLRTRTIDMTVADIRRKLRAGVARPKVVQTVRGQGYMFLSDVG